jgi:hypothetical protein
MGRALRLLRVIISGGEISSRDGHDNQRFLPKLLGWLWQLTLQHLESYFGRCQCWRFAAIYIFSLPPIAAQVFRVRPLLQTRLHFCATGGLAVLMPGVVGGGAPSAARTHSHFRAATHGSCVTATAQAGSTLAGALPDGLRQAGDAGCMSTILIRWIGATTGAATIVNCDRHRHYPIGTCNQLPHLLAQIGYEVSPHQSGLPAINDLADLALPQAPFRQQRSATGAEHTSVHLDKLRGVIERKTAGRQRFTVGYNQQPASSSQNSINKVR